MINDALEMATDLLKLGLVATGAGLGIKELLRKEYRQFTQQEVEFREPSEHEIILGYHRYATYNVPIYANMRQCPHMLVSGLSQQGKSSMVEYAMQGKNVLLLNAFDTDFTSLEPIERVNDMEGMVHMLQYLIDLKQNNEILYVVIDELLELVISNKKKMLELITQLLATAAHKNIYIIAISQSAEKETLKCKNLFNTRVSFKQVDDASYKVVLGYQPEDADMLGPREFYYLTSRKGRGQTYELL